MSPFRPSRERRGEDRFLHWKVLIFFVGAAVGLIGMARGDDRIVITAAAILALGVLLRIASRRE
ncbi:MAG TPA: hypothetical protein VKZ58_03950 [Longimicrobiales bacterium]|mgnify:CR=1 FL=1|nr:hypothetical protein [Longimicrobiales bacterium]